MQIDMQIVVDTGRLMLSLHSTTVAPIAWPTDPIYTSAQDLSVTSLRDQYREWSDLIDKVVCKRLTRRQVKGREDFLVYAEQRPKELKNSTFF